MPRLPRMAKFAMTILFPVFMDRKLAPNKTVKVKKTNSFLFFFKEGKWIGIILLSIFSPVLVDNAKASRIRVGRTNAKIGCQKNTRTEN